MSKESRTFGATLVGGILVVVPVYLGVLLLLKATKSLADLLKPITALFPRWLPGDQMLSVLLLLAICFLVGVAIGTPAGRQIENRALAVRENPGLRVISKSHATTRW